MSNYKTVEHKILCRISPIFSQFDGTLGNYLKTDLQVSEKLAYARGSQYRPDHAHQFLARNEEPFLINYAHCCRALAENAS